MPTLVSEPRSVEERERRVSSIDPVATSLPALAAVGLVVAVWIGLHAYELLWWREERATAG
jgi:hypothetical protein